MSHLPGHPQHAGPVSFGETDWWVIGKAGQPKATGAEEARRVLCEAYWAPAFRYVRRLGYSPEDAEDITQSFFARMIEKNYVRAAASKKGRFRSFLLVMLKRFLADWRDRANCQKRGGRATTVSLDSGDTEFRSRNEPLDPLTPEKKLERFWASELLKGALQRLEQQLTASGNKQELQRLLPLVAFEGEESYAAVAQAIGWTEVNVKVCVHRMRRRLAELVKQELMIAGAAPREVEEEIQDQLLAFS